MMFRGYKSLVSILVSMSLVFASIVAGERGTQAKAEDGATRHDALTRTNYGNFPLIFEKNDGQTDNDVKFVSRAPGYIVYLTQAGAVFSLQSPDDRTPENPNVRKGREVLESKTKSDTLKMSFVNANQIPTVAGEQEVATKTNYYIGQKRFEKVSNYGRVRYDGLYEGIDALFYGNVTNQLEYDFEVASNADPSQILLQFDGVTSISTDGSGDLVIKTANSELVQTKPIAYQTVHGERHDVDVRYVVNDSKVSFALGEYDTSLPLTIDPALDYLTYIGGTGFDSAAEIAVDANLNAYITGTTGSLDFHNETRQGSDADGVYAAKINADGTQFVYITILEGTGNDDSFDIALDSNNNAYLAGIASRNFPTTPGAYDTVHGIVNGQDGFVAKLNANGGIVYASYLGGTDADAALGVAVDGGGKAYVVGETFSATGFPKKNQFQGCGIGIVGSTDSLDAFLTVFNASGSDITYSTCIGVGGFVGGSFSDIANAVAVDANSNAYVIGITGGAGSFPTKNAAQPNGGGGVDAWVAKFNPAASGDASVVYSTYLGGSGTDEGIDIAVTPNGVASVTGVTGSVNFPLKNAFDITNQINEAFIAQYSASGAQLNSSFLGGADQDTGTSIAIGNGGTIYVGGETLSNNFPLATPFQATRRGLRDAFVAKIRFGINSNPGVSSASFLGGSGNDRANGIAVRGPFILVSGRTESNNLFTTSGVVKQTSNANADNDDGFVAKVLDSRKETIGAFDPVDTVFELRNTLNNGAADIVVNRGVAGDIGVAGDFNGDGIDTVATFNNGTWTILNFNVIVSGYATPPIIASFGLPGDLPVVGDWDGDGIETIGTYRPSVGQFFLSNSITTPAVNAQITFGIAEDLPIAGDWDGDGIETVGVFRPSVGQFFLTNQNISSPPIDAVAFFGTAGDLPVGGDWDGDGKDSIGVWRPSSLEFFLSNDNIAVANQFVFGAFGDLPVVGDWDGKP